MKFDRLYYRYLTDIVCSVQEEKRYSEVLEYLHSYPFSSALHMDQNRAADGIEMRVKFANSYKDGLYFNQIMNEIDNVDCSVLEMMVALAVRMERDIMNDDSLGDRTGKWFWHMMENVGLDVENRDFDQDEAAEKLDICLERGYDYEGHGSFFTVNNPPKDMRETDIWYQMQWWLNYEYLDWD